MTITILHLSDIHIHNTTDVVLKRKDAIAAALIPKLRDASALVILLSGDIAQSGSIQEYLVAENFLSALIERISEESRVPISVFMAPGNHDCDFSGDQDVRLAIVDAVKKQGVTIPDGYISACVNAQKNFVSFRMKFEKSVTVVTDDPLWRSYSLDVHGKRIVFDMLNASWMSTKVEQQGGLLFPFERYKTIKQSDTDLRIVTLHHPLNWYNQTNYLKFRGFIHNLADIVFTGHEHQSSSRTSDDANSGECVYVEGAALQKREDVHHSGFNIVTIEMASGRFRYTPFVLSAGQYEPTSTKAEWHSFRSLPKRDSSEFALTDAFKATLLDPGATLKHPSGIALTLEDIYVFPDLDARVDKRSDKVKAKSASKPSSKILTDVASLAKDVLIGGTEVAGKTCLLYRLFEIYHNRGFFPLLLRGKNIRRSSNADIERYVGSAIDAQYGNQLREKFLQLSSNQKVLLVDDLDISPVNGLAKTALLKNLKFGFHRMIVTVGDNFELAEIFEGNGSIYSADFDQYQISPFGYERRGDLIRKWIAIGQDETRSVNEVLKIFDDAENLIENARLQHIASTVPIYVLSLLQASASGLSSELHNSSFAHYYYFLIIGALEKGGVKSEEMGPYIAACTHLSWFIKTKGDEHRISSLEFDEFVAGYSDEWTQTDAKALLKVLMESRLVEIDGGAISFAYPYSYYYFLGRYASISLGHAEVNDYLKYCVKNLYVRECANTLLFLAHHTGNSAVLEVVINALKGHFSERVPMTLAKEDAKVVGSLMAVAPSLKYKSQKPDEYRKSVAKHQDQNGDHDGLVEKPSTKRELFNDIISLIKSIEIAGALLTHQFSNYQKAKKVETVKQVFDGSLRAIRELYSFFEQDPDQLVESLSMRIRQGSNLTADQAESQTRVAIGMLLRAITAGFINKAGTHLTSRELVCHVDEVMGGTPSQAYRLIKISQLLQQSGRLPRLEIDRIVRDEGNNPCVMGPLQMLVLQRMYMYETDYDDKDWATSVFSLGGASTVLELRHRKGSQGQNWNS
jgi:predicted MPP superfamily phosphohydrolase